MSDSEIRRRKELCEELRAMHATYQDVRSRPIQEQVEWFNFIDGGDYIQKLGYLLRDLANLDVIYRGWAECAAHHFCDVRSSETSRAALDAFLSQMVYELPAE